MMTAHLDQGLYNGPAGIHHDMSMGPHPDNPNIGSAVSSNSVITMENTYPVFESDNDTMYEATVAHWQQLMIEGNIEDGFLDNHRGQQMNGDDQRFTACHPERFDNGYPQGQDMNTSFQGQDMIDPTLRNLNHFPEQNIYGDNAQQMIAPTTSGISEAARHLTMLRVNSFGQAPRDMIAPATNGSVEAAEHMTATARNGFAEAAGHRQSQGPVILGSVAASAQLVIANGFVNEPGNVEHNNNGFVPLFKDEKAFNERKAAKEMERERSDYPYDNLSAQYDILGRLYTAFRNTNDVEDSAKVAAKFADGSYSEEDYQTACWKVMIRCRDSQELKGLLIPEYHKTKFLAKDTFTQRIESVIQTLHYSKAACKSVLAPSFLDRLVDQPELEGQRKRSNKKLNMNKTAQNKAGQKAIQKNYADKDGAWTGTPVDEADDAGHEAESELEEGEASTGQRGRRKREDDEDATQAPKRTRR